MTSRLLSFCLLLSFQLIAIRVASAQSFKGQWQGTSEGEVGMMTFDKKGYVSFIIDGQPMGGKKFTSEGVDLTMRYEYNEQKEPHTIDFIISMAEDGMELVRMLGIYKFENAKALIINMDFQGNSRPEAFDEDDINQVKLMKVK